MSEPEITAEDALQVAQRALQKANEAEADIEDLKERIVGMELRLSEIDDSHDYEDLSLDMKIGMVREHAYEMANNGHGRATLDYKDVMWGVFDGEPGPNHCYKLLRLAAGLFDSDEDRPTGGTFPGFSCRDPDGDNYHLAVDAEKAKEGVAFYPGNKNFAEGGL